MSVLALPRVVIETGEGSVSGAVADALSDIEVHQALGAPTQCEIVFIPAAVDTDVGTALAPGTSLTVRVAGHDLPLFVGEVTAVEHVHAPDHAQEVRVRGYDPLHRLRKHQTPRVHLQVTPKDLASDLARDIALNVVADEPGPLWPRLIQHRQSDLELLLEVCERSGLFPFVDEGDLRLVTLRGTGETVPLTLGDSLFEASIELNADRATGSVTATGWDLVRAETHNGSASEARTGRQTDASVDIDSVGAGGERALLDEAAPDDALAAALAQAELDLRGASEIVLRGTAAGDTRLRPGCAVEIDNVDQPLAGRYVLTEVRHTIDRGHGFLSEISSAPPEPPARLTGATLTLGEVTSVDDPDGLGRVQLVLPTFGGVESGWVGVVSVAAGSGKGFVALPDVGDRVLVLLAQEDPARAVVLGGLFGADGPVDPGVEGGAVRRFTIRTPGGQEIQLDDEKKTLRLKDSTGNVVTLSPENVKVHAEVDLILDAPGRKVTIRAQSIDLETA